MCCACITSGQFARLWPGVLLAEFRIRPDTRRRNVMPRAIWKGSISFGLVSIPVELHTAVRDHRPKFRMLHGADKSPVRYERVCQREGKPVAWEDLVKGYEYERGHFIVITKEDLKT